MGEEYGRWMRKIGDERRRWEWEMDEERWQMGEGDGR